MSMLRSDVLLETMAGERIIKYFPLGRLSKAPAQRFNELFAVRPRWQLSDLEPYLSGLQVQQSLLCQMIVSVLS